MKSTENQENIAGANIDAGDKAMNEEQTQQPAAGAEPQRHETGCQFLNWRGKPCARCLWLERQRLDRDRLARESGLRENGRLRTERLAREAASEKDTRETKAERVRCGAWVAAPREDAAGGLIWETLRLAADRMNECGGGPLEDRLRMLAEAIEGAATAQVELPPNGGSESKKGVVGG